MNRNIFRSRPFWMIIFALGQSIYAIHLLLQLRSGVSQIYLNPHAYLFLGAAMIPILLGIKWILMKYSIYIVLIQAFILSFSQHNHTEKIALVGTIIYFMYKDLESKRLVTPKLR